MNAPIPINYRIIKSGNVNRREYLSLNRSPLFSNLPELDSAYEQKKSFKAFLDQDLPQLLKFYFPIEFKDHNNRINLEVNDLIIEEPLISEKEAYLSSSTWSLLLSLDLTFDWNCLGINILTNHENLFDDISKWIKISFKIGTFTLKEISSTIWEVREKKVDTKITIEIKEKREDHIFVSFRFQQTKKIPLCSLPKINEHGNFIINGHLKVVVCQSVRSPDVYFFKNDTRKYYGEIIPSKGPWISFYNNYSFNSGPKLELKFLNSKKTIGVDSIFDFFKISEEIKEILFAGMDNYFPKSLRETTNPSLNSKVKENKKNKKKEIDQNKYTKEWPKFLFEEKNSYFDIGPIGRKKLNKRSLLIPRLLNKTLAEDIKDENNNVFLSKNTLLNKENLVILKETLLKQKINIISLPKSTNDIYWVKILSTSDVNKSIAVIGLIEELPESKTYFDLSDFFCVISLYLNSYEDSSILDSEDDKDKLHNQVIRRVGDLLRNNFDSKFGGFLHQDMAQKYLANISQLKKSDLSKMSNIKDFDNLLRMLFNTSPLVQLQNQNNPLSENAYNRKVSVLGLGGFNADNTTLSARNVDNSHYGRYGIMSTQEGKHFGLIHNITIRAIINDYGQITAPYYRVKNGIVLNELIYLTSEEENEEYISHCDIRISEKNELLDDKIYVRHQRTFMNVPRNEVTFIDSSFFHLATVEESVGPFSPYDDATRRLMTANMQRGAISPLKNQAPLIASGIEATLFNNSYLLLKSKTDGKVVFVDSNKIIIENKNKERITHEINQLFISNKNILDLSIPLVKVGENVTKGQTLSNGHYSKNGELCLGYNLKVAYLSYHHNYEDAIVISDRLIKDDIFTFINAKEYSISRYNTSLGQEVFNNDNSFMQKSYDHLDDEGIVKVGIEVNENDILVRKLTPPHSSVKLSDEELLLIKVLGNKSQKYSDSSLYLPKGGRGTVYRVDREIINDKDELERVKVYVFYERKIESGDKLTTRYGNKGIVQIIPEVDMPFDEDGPFDMVLNPLGVPSRMNLGQLLEVLLAESAYRLNTKFLMRPFNTMSLDTIKQIANDAGIKDMGNKKVWDGRNGLEFEHLVYTGRIYTMLLNHKASEKIHARATGPYSLVFQQPLKGRKRDGGQRFGEMEVWGNEAHGVAKIIMRLFSSDDIYKRVELQNYLLFDKKLKFQLLQNCSESFNLTIQYLRAMGFDIEAKDFNNKKIDFYKYFSKYSKKDIETKNKELVNKKIKEAKDEEDEFIKFVEEK